MKYAIEYAIERAREPSTWRGLLFVLTAVGIAVSPDQQEAIVSAGMALAGLVGVFLPDAK